MSAALRSRLAASGSAPVVAWVYFVDKAGERAPATPDRDADAMGVSAERIRGRLRAVRRFQDLPVDARYLRLLSVPGLRLRHVSRWLNAASVEATPAALSALCAQDFVISATPVLNRSRRIEPAGQREPPKPADGFGLRPGSSPLPSLGPGEDERRFHGVAWYELDQVGVTALQRLGYTGAGVRVAMFDSGFRPDHKALRGLHLSAQRDFVFHDDQVYDNLHDDPATWDHGTATWSIVGGFDPPNFVGGAFGAEFVLCRTEDERTEYPAEEDNFVAALEWVDSLGVRLVSASVGYTLFDGDVGYTPRQRDGNTSAVSRAVDIAVSRGIAVVNSAGNDGPASATIICPADADSVISVGAVDSLGVVARFSSRGPSGDGQLKPEVMARGMENSVADSYNNGYRLWAGTSFAGPTAAAAAALLLEAHPGWDGFRLREALISTAKRSGAPDNTYGYGLVDAMAALHADPDIAQPLLPAPFSLIESSVLPAPSVGSLRLIWHVSASEMAPPAVQYRVLISSSATFSGAQTMNGADSSLVIPLSGYTPGTTYYWKVVARNAAGRERECYSAREFVAPTGAEVEPGAPVQPTGGPLRLVVESNPARGSLVVRFEGLSGASVRPGSSTVTVFDGQGRRIAELVPDSEGGHDPSGTLFRWNDRNGGRAPAGIYFLRGESGGRVVHAKAVVNR